MHVYYADESYDRTTFVLAALGLREIEWRPCLDTIKNFRKELRRDHGIKLKAGLHARTFIRHCSDQVSTRKLSIAERRRVFEKCLDFVATLPVKITNICLPLANFNHDPNKAHEAALDRLYNRVQATMAHPQTDSRAICAWTWLLH